MEGPEESKAGLNVITEVCWEPTLLVSLIWKGERVRAGEMNQDWSSISKRWRRGIGRWIAITSLEDK